MPAREASGHPEWYVKDLVARYQYLADEFARQSIKSVATISDAGAILLSAMLAFLAFGNVWAALLFPFVVFFIIYLAVRNRRYFLAMEMLTLEAQFPHIRENIAFPEREQ